ncbi:palmitoyltransferase for Vac8p [Dipsacomyces acuminosporus]|nr:palmitoyltransferase for Vac8p [Dipsacomyces acuminosporus]
MQRRYADEQSCSSSEHSGEGDSDYGANDSMDAESECSDSNAPLTQEQARRAELVYSITVKDNGQPRFCLKCNAPKPDRTHHCSICGRCILKMDHHCPWLNNCVGFHTQKAFLLFIFHGSLYCSTTFVTSVVYFLRDFMDLPGDTEINVGVIILIILSGVFALCLLVFTGFHIYLLLSNLTTIESYERNNYKIAHGRRSAHSKYVNLFNVGTKKNFHQVLGSRCLLWPVPISTTVGDGVRFPINYEGYNELQQD